MKYYHHNPTNVKRRALITILSLVSALLLSSPPLIAGNNTPRFKIASVDGAKNVVTISALFEQHYQDVVKISFTSPSADQIREIILKDTAIFIVGNPKDVPDSIAFSDTLLNLEKYDKSAKATRNTARSYRENCNGNATPVDEYLPSRQFNLAINKKNGYYAIIGLSLIKPFGLIKFPIFYVSYPDSLEMFVISAEQKKEQLQKLEYQSDDISTVQWNFKSNNPTFTLNFTGCNLAKDDKKDVSDLTIVNPNNDLIGSITGTIDKNIGTASFTLIPSAPGFFGRKIEVSVKFEEAGVINGATDKGKTNDVNPYIYSGVAGLFLLIILILTRSGKYFILRKNVDWNEKEMRISGDSIKLKYFPFSRQKIVLYLQIKVTGSLKRSVPIETLGVIIHQKRMLLTNLISKKLTLSSFKIIPQTIKSSDILKYDLSFELNTEYLKSDSYKLLLFTNEGLNIEIDEISEQIRRIEKRCVFRQLTFEERESDRTPKILKDVPPACLFEFADYKDSLTDHQKESLDDLVKKSVEFSVNQHFSSLTAADNRQFGNRSTVSNIPDSAAAKTNSAFLAALPDKLASLEKKNVSFENKLVDMGTTIVSNLLEKLQQHFDQKSQPLSTRIGDLETRFSTLIQKADFDKSVSNIMQMIDNKTGALKQSILDDLKVLQENTTADFNRIDSGISRLQRILPKLIPYHLHQVQKELSAGFLNIYQCLNNGLEKDYDIDKDLMRSVAASCRRFAAELLDVKIEENDKTILLTVKGLDILSFKSESEFREELVKNIFDQHFHNSISSLMKNSGQLIVDIDTALMGIGLIIPTIHIGESLNENLAPLKHILTEFNLKETDTQNRPICLLDKYYYVDSSHDTDKPLQKINTLPIFLINSFDYPSKQMCIVSIQKGSMF